MLYSADDRRIRSLLEMGFSLMASQQGLEEALGDVDKASELLLASEARQLNKLVARRINSYLNRVRPWSEFFEKFLWPENWWARVETNLSYYQANYVAVCTFLALMWGLSVPRILLRIILCVALDGVVFLHLADGGGQQRGEGRQQHQQVPSDILAGACGLANLLLVGPHVFSLFFLASICSAAVLCHASFRARSIPSRLNKLSENMQNRIKNAFRLLGSPAESCTNGKND